MTGYNPISAIIRCNPKDWTESEVEKLPPLPSLWFEDNGEFGGDGMPLVLGGMLGGEFEEADGFSTFQDLLLKGKHDVTILNLAKDPRSYRIQKRIDSRCTTPQ